MTKYSCKILLKDDVIACCSQMCTETCPNFDSCEDCVIEIKEDKQTRRRVEQLYK